jgi:hypothetical protein
MWLGPGINVLPILAYLHKQVMWLGLGLGPGINVLPIPAYLHKQVMWLSVRVRGS